MRRGYRGAAMLMRFTSASMSYRSRWGRPKAAGNSSRLAPKPFASSSPRTATLVHVHLDGSTFTIRHVDPVQRYGSHAGAGADDIAEAPMPGVVIAVHVKEGQPVAAGDTLMVIESMKLETAIKAWREGAVAAVHVGVGQAFQRGAPLLSLAPQSGA